MWRPERWDATEIAKQHKDAYYVGQAEIVLVEAGADAMVKACREALCEVCLAGSDMPDCPLKEPCKFRKILG